VKLELHDRPRRKGKTVEGLLLLDGGGAFARGWKLRVPDGAAASLAQSRVVVEGEGAFEVGRLGWCKQVLVFRDARGRIVAGAAARRGHGYDLLVPELGRLELRFERTGFLAGRWVLSNRRAPLVEIEAPALFARERGVRVHRPLSLPLVGFTVLLERMLRAADDSATAASIAIMSI
jgi:hypothetical protein